MEKINNKKTIIDKKIRKLKKVQFLLEKEVIVLKQELDLN